MKIDIKEGDIIFRQAANGWIVEKPIDAFGEESEDFLQTIVVEEKDNVSKPESESLVRALWEAFDGYFQSKYNGGIVISYKDKGRDIDDC